VARSHTRLIHGISALIVLVGLLYNFDGYSLLDPDEGRNAEIAREMSESNDYVLPHLNGLPYIDKPVLFFAVGAGFMEVLGPTSLAARLPALLFTLGTLALMAWHGRRIFGPGGGWIAAIATAATPLTLAFSRTVIFDSTLTFFVTLSLLAFFYAFDAHAGDEASGPAKEKYGWWIATAWAAMALGVLTKGPIALAIPLMVAVPYAVWRRQYTAFVDSVALLLFLALVLPWVLAMSREVPGFLDYALVTETFKRLTTDELQRSGPIWYFFPILFFGTLPWSLVIVGGWKRGVSVRDDAGRVDRRVVFFALWIIVPLLFFTLSRSKRPQYVLPLIPAMGALVAYLWTRLPDRASGGRVAAAGLVGAGLVVLASPLIVPALVSVDRAIQGALPVAAIVLGGVAVVGGAVAWYVKSQALTMLALCLPVAAIAVPTAGLMDAIGRDRSAASLAAGMESAMTPATEVVVRGTYPLSLPFYLRRTLTIATNDGTELTSNYLALTYDRWTRQMGSPFRDMNWWLDALVRCDRPRIFVVPADHQELRALVAARLNLLAEGSKAAAYGPCNATDLARSLPHRVEATTGH
jgi:4-amino-4-deoxy-L-arabinose transferase-like glycosyltransferase